MNRSLPTRSLRKRPDLDQLKRQAKELLRAFIAGEKHAVAEVTAHYRQADRTQFALHHAQLVLARTYGFDSWPKLKAFVDGVTVKRLIDAVRAGKLTQVQALLKVRPELAHMSMNNLQVLHHAVLSRSAEMVRVLMQHGANARQGVYPYGDATTPLTIARERNYQEIVAIIEEEQRRSENPGGASEAPAPGELFRVISSRDNGSGLAMLRASPELVHSRSAEGWTPLHVASRALNEPVVAFLLDHGADARAGGWHELTPLDLAANFSDDKNSEAFATVAALLLGHGAVLTAPAAVALGDMDWLRARHAEGGLVNPIEDSGGLLRLAVSHNRPAVLSLLLDCGFDPDERTRFGAGDEDEVVFTRGMPLWCCAATGNYEIAKMLLERGADANSEVYASGTPLYQAYGRRDWNMVELLQHHGGQPDGTLAGLYRQTELAKSLLEGAAAGNPRPDGSFAGKPLAEELLWAGACGGDPEIVRMALSLVEWPRHDPRWFGALEQPLRMWNHGHGHWANPEFDRGTYLTCFLLILERCDPDVRGRTTDLGQSGPTILHAVAGAREHLLPEERAAFAAALLDAGARTDLRDNLLESTALGWACRWGRLELVKVLLERGADPVEAGAEPWAAPKAWAQKMGHDHVLTLLREHGG